MNRGKSKIVEIETAEIKECLYSVQIFEQWEQRFAEFSFFDAICKR